MLHFLPPQVETFLLAMLPVLELRFAIPYAMTALEMPAWHALLWALLGNTAISIILLWGLDPVTRFLRAHVPGMKRFTDWLFERTRAKHSQRVSELGHVALFLFVAIPLPGSGAWTGSLIAYLFDVKKRSALLWISLGLVAASLIITFGFSGILAGIKALFG